MFCSNCGENVLDGSLKCSKCGHPTGSGGTIRQEFEGGAIKGFFLMVLYFFTMPLKTLRLTRTSLRDVGARGALDVGHTSVPHLTWLVVASNLMASIVIVVILLWGISKGLMSLGDFKYSAKDALLGLIGYPLGGLLSAAIADWVIMIGIELLSLIVNISNDVRKIVEYKSSRS